MSDFGSETVGNLMGNEWEASEPHVSSAIEHGKFDYELLYRSLPTFTGSSYLSKNIKELFDKYVDGPSQVDKTFSFDDSSKKQFKMFQYPKELVIEFFSNEKNEFVFQRNPSEQKNEPLFFEDNHINLRALRGLLALNVFTNQPETTVYRFVTLKDTKDFKPTMKLVDETGQTHTLSFEEFQDRQNESHLFHKNNIAVSSASIRLAGGPWLMNPTVYGPVFVNSPSEMSAERELTDERKLVLSFKPDFIKADTHYTEGLQYVASTVLFMNDDVLGRLSEYFIIEVVGEDNEESIELSAFITEAAETLKNARNVSTKIFLPDPVERYVTQNPEGIADNKAALTGLISMISDRLK